MRLYRVSFLSGLAAGYVLGTRAGRERYDQMHKIARSVADSPAVQEAAAALQARASGMMKSGWDRAASECRKGVARIGGRSAEAGQASTGHTRTAGNGSSARTDNGSRPFVPANGENGDHDPG